TRSDSFLGAQHMKRQSIWVYGAVMVGLLAMGGCAPDVGTPVEPSSAMSHSLLGNVVGGLTNTVGNVTGSAVNAVVSLVRVPVVTRSSALPPDVPVTQTIGTAGGTIAMPQADLTITFAPGAVTSNTPITVTAYAGTALAFGFGPHGLVFKAPVTF